MNRFSCKLATGTFGLSGGMMTQTQSTARVRSLVRRRQS